MDSRWLKAIPLEEKEKERKRILASQKILHQALEILEESFEEGTPDYGNPSWAYEQADRNGANRKLREVINFLKVK